ncbi:rCG50603 [Rattus norvegicus]|uniref:RCG50603 n=1 Tax=Rattus norvegicus TaxID=10116 RepID=A6KCD3_RAT|nr:rCG50603 [Rattus norvegicus]
MPPQENQLCHKPESIGTSWPKLDFLRRGKNHHYKDTFLPDRPLALCSSILQAPR